MTDYQRQLQQDVLDMDAYTKGLQAFERISGVPLDKSLNTLAFASSLEQRERVVKVTARLQELAKLTPAQKAAALGLNPQVAS